MLLRPFFSSILHIACVVVHTMSATAHFKALDSWSQVVAIDVTTLSAAVTVVATTSPAM